VIWLTVGRHVDHDFGKSASVEVEVERWWREPNGVGSDLGRRHVRGIE